MNISLLNGALKNFWNTVTDFFDLIPKVIYFLYASLASCVDAMQLLVRKLAGLDIYYQSGVAIARRDPLTEFIYGIIGYGENAAVYKGLSTVFWSLVIFAVIVLAVCTMVAIIKSHYNEDTAGTSPWKYIYQAIKAVLTFVAIPAVVLIGMRLNTFILSTLDKIIAGSANEEKIVGIYGAEATEKFKAGTMEGTEDKSYIYYDYFGLGDPTSTTTFSGMLFKAAAYNCNRARNGSVGYEEYKKVKVGEVSLFASGDGYDNAEDKQEFVAYQIDFAFQNNLHLTSKLDWMKITSSTGINVNKGADLWMQANVKNFTKFNPSLIWQFYNLWQFNFIIAFASVFAVFAIMISIIIGLMSRLIKGVALFMIYPTLLGLAPLDNFKAFKDWGGQFIKQILMAIGSIVGINLLLLILPYIQSISFFNNTLLDAIINVLLLVVGLAMAKDFISMVSGFVGGADALSVGGGLKGEATANLKKSIGMTAKVGLGTARVMGKAGWKVGQEIRKRTAANRANKYKDRAQNGYKDKRGRYHAGEGDVKNANKNLKSAEDARDQVYKDLYNDSSTDKMKVNNASKKARNDYKATHKGDDYDKKEEDRIAKEARQAELRRQHNGDTNLISADRMVDGAKRAKDEAEKDYNKSRDKENALVAKYGLKKDYGSDDYAGYKSEIMKQQRADKRAESRQNFKDSLGKWGKMFTDSVDSTSLGKTMADVFTKTVQQAGSGMGLDKAVAGAVDTLKGTLSFKGGFVKKPDMGELSGDKLARATAKEQQKESEKQTKLMEEFVKEQKKTQEKLDELNSTTKTTKGSGSGKGTTPPTP